MSNGCRYDVAIIGSGIAGSALGAILARQGLQVVIFEAQSHPKFAIGESMILETSESLRAMAERFDVPELAYLSSEHYFAHVGGSHGVKRHFSYLHHLPGQSQQVAHSLQAIIPKEPHGHELHLFRQDSDSFMVVTAIAYGATVLQNTPVKDIDLAEGGGTVVTAQGDRYQASYVVDAGGFRSLLADKFNLRHTALQTHSRALFTHMVGVPDYHERGASQKRYGMPFSLAEGTLHHIFPGGWLWVIPFNNHPQSTNPLCSVGLMLDPRIHPVQEDLSPQEEFQRFIAQFPSIQEHLRGARAVRSWTRTGRIQYGSTQVVGERWSLLGHAAGFIDPLFSKGLYVSLMSTAVLADLLLDAHRDGDYSAARFQPLERLTQNFVRSNDRLIANSYKSFSNYKLWDVYSVMWLLGAYTEYVKLLSIRMQSPDRASYFQAARQLKLVGGAFPDFDRVAEQVDAIMERVDPALESEVDQAVAEIRAVFDQVPWMPGAFQEILAGKNHLPANKLKLQLFRKETGFLGSGAYRQHFFGNHSMASIGRAFVAEKARYWLTPRYLARLNKSKNFPLGGQG